MPLSAEKQNLFDHAKNMLPRFLTAGVSAALEWLYAYTDEFDAARAQTSEWLEMSFISTASGRWLDQHARDRGTSRRLNEDDATLRVRLRQYEDLLTFPAIIAAVNAILVGAGGSADAELVFLRRDRAHCQLPAAVNAHEAFLSRGYRMTNATTPMGYIVILPFGTSEATGLGVEEYLRQYGPAGYYYIVEIRGVP